MSCFKQGSLLLRKHNLLFIFFLVRFIFLSKHLAHFLTIWRTFKAFHTPWHTFPAFGTLFWTISSWGHTSKLLSHFITFFWYLAHFLNFWNTLPYFVSFLHTLSHFPRFFHTLLFFKEKISLTFSRMYSGISWIFRFNSNIPVQYVGKILDKKRLGGQFHQHKKWHKSTLAVPILFWTKFGEVINS